MAWDWGYQYNALVSFPDYVWEPDYLHTHTVGKHTVTHSPGHGHQCKCQTTLLSSR